MAMTDATADPSLRKAAATPTTHVVIEPKAIPTLHHPEAEGFYAEAIRELTATGFPFLLAGTYALSAYTGISRPTKDLDVFCKAGDYQRILAHFQSLGFAVYFEDERWLGKVF